MARTSLPSKGPSLVSYLDVGLGFRCFPSLDLRWMHLLHGHTSSHLQPPCNDDRSNRCLEGAGQ